MSAGPLARMIRYGIAGMAIIALPGVAKLEAQVGLSSRVAQVALIARVAPQASMRQAGATTEMARHGGSKELSVKVRVSANAGYRLVAVGTAPSPGSRLWVRDTGGEFRELAPGTAVTVARGLDAAGDWLGEVRYRSEATNPDAGSVLPVRYEVRVEPTI